MNTYEQIRETLVTIRALATCGGSDFGNPAIRGLLDQMDTIRAMAQSALAVPPRNCDVGTAEEQRSRFEKFCNSHSWEEIDGTHCGSSCPLYHGDASRCDDFEWEQIPYKAKSEAK